MIHILLKSKIHNVVVTDAQLDYVGSITIDKELMEASGLKKNEHVLVVNNNNGERIETYVIPGERGSGVICLNGAAAHRFNKGDVAIIMAFTPVREEMVDDHEPSVIFPYDGNLKWKMNDDICEELLLDILEKEGDITKKDMEAVALKMGRDFEYIANIVKKIQA